MAPEVIRQGYSDTAQPCYDPAAADVWSLGVILYRLVTGRGGWCLAGVGGRACSEVSCTGSHGLVTHASGSKSLDF